MTTEIKITGTMMPILVMGEHYGRTPADLWDEAVGLAEKPQVDNGHTRRGLTLESHVLAQRFANGEEWIAQYEPRLELDQGVIATGHVDAYREKPEKVVTEVKCPAMRTVWDIKDDGPAKHMIIQASHYVMCADADYAEILVWSCDDWDFYRYVVPRSAKLESLMRKRAIEFGRCVLEGRRPETWSDESEVVPVIGKQTIDAPEGWIELLRDLDQAESMKKACDRRASEIKSQLISMWPEDAKGIRSAIGTLSLQAGRRTTNTDLKTLTSDHPEIDWAAYQRVVEGSPFLVWRSKKSKSED